MNRSDYEEDSREEIVNEVPSGVGGTLAASRQKMNLTREDVARALRIRVPYLKAIEEGQFHELPGKAYASGFVRGYAEYLGLDGEEMVRRFKEEGGNNLKDKSSLDMPSVPTEERIPGGAIIFIALILAVVGYGVWQYSVSEDKNLLEIIEAVPDQVMGLISDITGGSDEANDSNTGTPPAPQISPPAPVAPPAPATPPPGSSSLLPGTSPSVAATDRTETRPDTPVERPTVSSSADETVSSSPREIANAPGTSSSTAEEANRAEDAPPGPVASSPVEETPASQTLASVSETSSAPGAAEEAPAPSSLPASLPESVALTPPLAVPFSSHAEETPRAAPQETAPLQVAEAPESSSPSETTVTAAANETPEPSVFEPSVINTPSVQPHAPGATYGTENAGGRIVVRATTAQVWMRVSDGERIVFERTLNPGESYLAPNRSGLRLRVGNAPAVEILVDGKRSGIMGASRTTTRTITLNADELAAFNAAD